MTRNPGHLRGRSSLGRRVPDYHEIPPLLLFYLAGRCSHVRFPRAGGTTPIPALFSDSGERSNPMEARRAFSWFSVGSHSRACSSSYRPIERPREPLPDVRLSACSLALRRTTPACARAAARRVSGGLNGTKACLPLLPTP